nr:type II toxin-antitoxin system HicA family toxin [Companilactobacillus ginsenosidimutans]
MKPKELLRVLKSAGFLEKSQRGSHLKLVNYTTGIIVVVPIHARELKIGMQNAILKKAGLFDER